MRKTLFIYFIIILFSSIKTIKAQSIGSVQVLAYHIDTTHYNTPLSIDVLLVNTGNVTLYDSLVGLIIATTPATQGNNPPFTAQNFSQSITQNGFAPGDSILWNFNSPLQTGGALYQQTGDNIVVIWPSFVSPVDIDTSFTSLHVLPNSSAIQEKYTKKKLLKIVDLLGRESSKKSNKPLFFIYEEGVIERKLIIE